LGVSRLKRLVTDGISRAFTTREFKKFCWMIQPDLDFYKLTGYPLNMNIPIKEAAKQVIDYFYKTDRILVFLDLIIKSVTIGFKGEKVVINNIKDILKEMKECGYEYSTILNKVVIIDKQGKRNDWGYLTESKFYNFCFVSIDICGNSNLVRKYDGTLIQKTYANFKRYVSNMIEKRDGRIWSWEGDGGLIVFHLNDFVNQALLASIEIISNMPVFNAVSNYLDDNLLIRIGINAGVAEYKKNIEMIDSEAINEAKKIEKNHTEPMTISVTTRTLQNIDIIIRKCFCQVEINNKTVYQLRFPILGSEI